MIFATGNVSVGRLKSKVPSDKTYLAPIFNRGSSLLMGRIDQDELTLIPSTMHASSFGPRVHSHRIHSHRQREAPYHRTMLQDEESLYLYNLTLKHSSLAQKCIIGQFSAEKKTQELVLATSTTIEIYRPNAETGKLKRLMVQNAFAIVQDIEKIRITGTQKDLLIITSDSGKVVVAEFDVASSKFVPIVQEPHSKNGLRRVTPGEYLCVDPDNRAFMIAAVERNKLIYKVEMEKESGSLDLSSPLESATRDVLTLNMCALDTNYENPVWAAIEVNYLDYEDKLYDPSLAPLLLNYYELDQSINHITQKKSKPDLDSSANLLVPVPAPCGGVIICCNSFLIYEPTPGGARKYLQLPKRQNSEESIITSFFVHKLKKNDFFILLQTSFGDLFKITVATNKDKESITSLFATYFDSIPVCKSLVVLKSGFLFANTTDSNKLFYQFENLGETDDSTVSSVDDISELPGSKYFVPQGLKNLALVEVLESLSPLVDSTLLESYTPNFPDPLKQLVTLSSNPHMKTLTYGVPISELVSSPVPISPTSIYTTKLSDRSVNDDYLVLSTSLNSKSMVLSIGEVVEEVSDSGFVLDQNTITVQQIGKNSVVQIHTNGIRHIYHSFDESGDVVDKKITNWYPPAGIVILHASANNEQVLIGLSNRDACYFEIDPSDDQLIEYQERFEVPGGSITSLAIASNFVDENDRKSKFAIIGSLDETIQVISLMQHNCFDVVTLQALSANSYSLLMMPMDKNTYFVHIGMVNGIYVRVSIDISSGKLGDTRLKYLGTQPVSLKSLALPNLRQSGILAISSRPWIGYFNNEFKFKLTPLIDLNILDGASFYSEDIGVESVVGIRKGELTIFTVGSEDTEGFDVTNDFTVNLIKLRYAPRKQIKDTDSNHFFVIESEFNVKSPYLTTSEVDTDYYDIFGYEKEKNRWASCLQVVDFTNSEVSMSFEFENNECLLSLCLAKFKDDEYLMVGATKDLEFSPSSNNGSLIYTFKIKRDQSKAPGIELLHKTMVDSLPSSLCVFNEKLLVGMGGQLRLYEMGRKQLLRKSTSKVDFLRRVNKIHHLGGDIIVVGDSSESVSVLTFDHSKNQFRAFCNDTIKRQITSFEVLDNRTVIAGDKFGNIFVNRIPKSIAEQIDNNVLLKFQEDSLGASSSRFIKICDFFIQDIVTSFQKGSFVVGGSESIIYTCIQGTVGLLLPLATKQEVNMLITLETLLRDHFSDTFDDFDKSKNGPNLVGKDHIKFRGYYNSVKNVIDGDFIERFYELNQSTKIRISGKMDKTPREVERKIYDLRNRTAF